MAGWLDGGQPNAFLTFLHTPVFLLVLLAFLVLLWCKSRLILTLVADVSADLTKSSLTPIQLGKCLTPHKKGDEVLYGTLKCFIPHTHHISQRRYL